MRGNCLLHLVIIKEVLPKKNTAMRRYYLRSLEFHSLLLRFLVASRKEDQGVWVKDVPVTRNGETFMRGIDKYGYPVAARGNKGSNGEESRADVIAIAQMLGEKYQTPESISSITALGDPKDLEAALNRDIQRQQRRKQDLFSFDRSPFFTDRLKETIDLMNKKHLSKEEAISLKWHRGLIDAELKYGERVDSLSMPNKDLSPNEAYELSDNTYNSIIESLKDGNNNKNIRLKETDIVNNDETNFLDEREYDRLIIQTRQIVEFVKTIIGTKVDFALSQERSGRSFARPLTKTQEIVISPYLGFQADKYILHEVGHLIEVNEGFTEESKNYINSRTKKGKNGKPLRLGEAYEQNGDINDLLDRQEAESLYSEEEIKTFKASDFDEYYITKEYTTPSTKISTELISMGVQELLDRGAFEGKAETDREHLMFTLYFVESTHHDN